MKRGYCWFYFFQKTQVQKAVQRVMYCILAGYKLLKLLNKSAEVPFDAIILSSSYSVFVVLQKCSELIIFFH